MTDRIFIPPTPRRKMTKARSARIFLSRNGRCWRCTNQIRDGEAYTIEHPDPLNLGGSDDDADLWPVHVKCGIKKTREDVKLIAARNRSVTRGLVRPKRSWGNPNLKRTVAGGVVDRRTGEPVGSRRVLT